jgi:hypothetical protein
VTSPSLDCGIQIAARGSIADGIRLVSGIAAGLPWCGGWSEILGRLGPSYTVAEGSF